MHKPFPTLRVRHVAGLAEAAWLAAILLVPWYFNPFTRRCFDPDRATLHIAFGLTACLSVLVALAALRRRFQLFLAPEHEDVAARFALKNVDRAVWLFFLSLMVSAVFSLSPQISIFGAYERGTSVLTTLAGLSLFLSIRCFLTKRAQLEYAFLAFPLATVPIAVYAMCQKAGWDVIRWSNYFLGRVGGSLGNPIFLGAVMALALILTLRNIYLTGREVSSPDPVVSSKALQRFVCFTGAAFLQAGALLLSGSRGPMLALMAGVFVMAVLGLACRGRKRAAVIVLFAPLAVVALLLVGRNLLEYAKVPPSVSHIFHILDEEGGNSRVRLLIWRGVSSMSVSWRTLRDAENNPDRYARLRPLIGYGPETMSLSFDPYFPTELGRLESRSSVIDKCHNEGWEAVATRGWFGFAAYSLLFMTLFAFGLDQLGFTPARRNKRNLLLSMSGGGLGGAGALMLLKSVEYAMLGWAVGIIAGMLLYALRAHRTAGGRSWEETCSLLALLGALIVLFVETQFGFLTVATNAWFWIVAGMLVSLSSCFRSHAFFCGHEARPFREFFPEGLTVGLMASLLATSALFSVSSIPYERISLGRQLWRTVTGPAGVIVAVLCLWAFLLVFVMRSARKPANGPAEAPLLSYWVAVLTSIVVFGVWVAFRQAGCTEFPLEPESERFLRAGAIGNVVIVPAAAFVCLIALLAFRRSRRGPGEAAAGDVRISPVFLASLGAFVLALAWCFGLQKIQADRYSQEALYAAGRGAWNLAVAAGREALHLNPNEAVYASDLGRYYYRKAAESAEPAAADRLSIDAERFLNLAFSHSPWRAVPAQVLADYHLWRAGVAVSPAVSKLHAERAEYFYQVAIRLAPNNPVILNNLAKLYLRIWKLPDRALDVLQKSLRLDREYCVTLALIGECWYEIGEERSFGASRRGLFLQALHQFEDAFRKDVKQEVENPMEIRLKMARMYLELGDEASYEDQAKLAIAAAQSEEKDVVREELNLLRRQMGPYDDAARAYHPRHSGKPKGASPAQDSLRKTAAPAL